LQIQMMWSGGQDVWVNKQVEVEIDKGGMARRGHDIQRFF